MSNQHDNAERQLDEGSRSRQDIAFDWRITECLQYSSDLVIVNGEYPSFESILRNVCAVIERYVRFWGLSPIEVRPVDAADEEPWRRLGVNLTHQENLELNFHNGIDTAEQAVREGYQPTEEMCVRLGALLDARSARVGKTNEA